MLAGRYRVGENIGGGSMGQVFRAVDNTGREVALKVLAAETSANAERFKKRFRREASIASQLGHPNIVTIYDYGEAESGDVFIAMELLPGQSLAQLLEREGRLPTFRAVGIAIQLARALRKAHSLGVMHRDLKPANVIVDQDEDGSDRVKVLDFGLVKLLSPEHSEVAGAFNDENLTAAGSMMGTPGYMAPEQAVGESTDARADQYALGVILFQMLTGRMPFAGNSVVELVRAQVLEPVPLLRQVAPELGLAPELEEIVARCLNKNRDERFESIDVLLSNLKLVWRIETDESYGTESIPLPITVPIAPAPATLILEPKPRRSPTLLLAILSLSLLGAAAGLWLGARMRPSASAAPTPIEQHADDYKANPY